MPTSINKSNNFQDQKFYIGLDVSVTGESPP